MHSNPVGWFEIYVQDLERARKFYEATLGVKLEKLDSPVPEIEMWAFPGAGREAAGASGAIAKMEGGPSGGGTSTLVYFTCDDCSVEAGRAAKNGGTVTKDKVSIGQYGFISLVTDTEGNVIGLHSMK
jgi:predicted enzyme related to lactoylglutathione lyase